MKTTFNSFSSIATALALATASFGAMSATEAQETVTIDVSVYQVALAPDGKTGIDWSNFDFKKTSPKSVVKFLSEQGSTKVLQQPRISVLDGGSFLVDATTTTRFLAPHQDGALRVVELKTGTMLQGSMHVKGSKVLLDANWSMSQLDGQRWEVAPSMVSSDMRQVVLLTPDATTVLPSSILAGTDPKTGEKTRSELVYVVRAHVDQ